ncbi:MAG: ComEC/Rec2 family competence protein [Candidatus Pacebacteria bacterium]|nr:ComEC/Rec2 family competence protein [Candidatus Paceibacterota bacterium]
MDWENNGAKICLFCIFLLVLANAYVWQFIFSLDGNLKIIFFDVGEGDSIFVVTPQGHQILIDGGPGERVLDKLAKVMPFWDKSLDLVVLTHPEYDHLSGLNKVLANYQVANVLWNGIKRDTAVFREWEEALKKEKAKVIIAQAGEQLKAGMLWGMVLNPLNSLQGQLFEKDSNVSSVILRFIYGRNSFLLTGDAPEKAEQAVISTDTDLDTQLLKVAHHGSRTSTSLDFLANVKPQVAVISCGRNNLYGHPDQTVLQNLLEFGINVLRTDLRGDIIVTADGSNLHF